jgi:uncharacterized protein (DUF1015 family)
VCPVRLFRSVRPSLRGQKAIRVPELEPFRGLRYAGRSDLTSVTAPPYDVIDPAQRVALAASDPNNPVRLILPEAVTGDPYAEAAATLAAWRADGTLVLDERPSLYAYRMEAPVAGGGSHRTTGVIGALALPLDRDSGEVLPHERTLPKAKSDRLALLRATRANLDPIWGLTLAGGLTELLDGVAPVATAVDDAGVRHELGLVDDEERIVALGDLVRSAPIVLADGHHRFETACSYRDHGGDAGAHAILCFVVELDDAQLDVRPFHRLVAGAPRDLRDRVGRVCAVRERGPADPESIARLMDEMETSDALGAVDAEGLVLLEPTDRLRDAVGALPPQLRDVDAARFDAALRPLLGDAALDYRSDAVSVTGSVADGSADAAFLLRAVTVAQIRDAADARVLMPEKTTYFAPKPRTGMVMRLLDAG